MANDIASRYETQGASGHVIRSLPAQRQMCVTDRLWTLNPSLLYARGAHDAALSHVFSISDFLGMQFASGMCRGRRPESGERLVAFRAIRTHLPRVKS